MRANEAQALSAEMRMRIAKIELSCPLSNPPREPWSTLTARA